MKRRQPVCQNQGAGGGTVNDDFAFDAAGVYHVTLTVVDDDGGSTTSQPSMFVVYDPSAGFVTGGGWIDSPPGADRLNPTATGRANFGFVSKYKKGANTPSGQTQFRFSAGDLDFHSDTYQWLVVAGARAQYKGTGTINGGGDYGFLLTAIDGQVNGGGGVDKFRIKIWDRDNQDTIRYDNQDPAMADDDATPSTGLGGGQILIHTGGKKQALVLDGTSLITRHAPRLTEVDLEAVVSEGIEHWDHQGLPAKSLDALSRIEFVLADLPGHTLGTTSDSTNVIWIDVDAAGHGWNVQSEPAQLPMSRVDLLSTITHELGHVLGLTHDYMEAQLELGHRHLPHLLDDNSSTDFADVAASALSELHDDERLQFVVEHGVAQHPLALQWEQGRWAEWRVAAVESLFELPLRMQRNREGKLGTKYETAIDNALDALMQTWS